MATFLNQFLSKEQQEQLLTLQNEQQENKSLICELFGELMKFTRAGSDIVSITYDETTDVAIVKEHHANNGQPYTSETPINIACDSGVAICVDILKYLY